ncbi:Zinc finger, PMZ-type [Sesbania bispinosa]|nr:Zinc finger, PMZ-type [Sesbania bispinosa]
MRVLAHPKYTDLLLLRWVGSKKDIYNQIGRQRRKRLSDAKASIIANETEHTYVWVSSTIPGCNERVAPKSVITDGDIAMRNAIRRVFPEARNRLCAWHLVRNATANIEDPAFTAQFNKCMVGDYEIPQFEQKWEEMIVRFGLEGNSWIKETYERRKMWATTHIWGQFFAGFRTTSRYYMRYNDMEAEFESSYGEPVLETNFESLERSSARVFTRDVFYKFCEVLKRVSTTKVIGCKQTQRFCIYIVSKYHNAGSEWYVSYNPRSVMLKCSCKRMESFGLPCVHIVAVMVFVDMSELPKCLILDRWTKNEKLKNEIEILEAKYVGDLPPVITNPANDATVDVDVGDPFRVAYKGCRGRSSPSKGKGRRVTHCGICKRPSHNRKTCPMRNSQSANRNEEEVVVSEQETSPETIS